MKRELAKGNQLDLIAGRRLQRAQSVQKSGQGLSFGTEHKITTALGPAMSRNSSLTRDNWRHAITQEVHALQHAHGPKMRWEGTSVKSTSPAKKRGEREISKQPPISLEQGADNSGGELIDSPVFFILSSLKRFLWNLYFPPTFNCSSVLLRGLIGLRSPLVSSLLYIDMYIYIYAYC